jgi:hypothetical protein
LHYGPWRILRYVPSLGGAISRLTFFIFTTFAPILMSVFLFSDHTASLHFGAVAGQSHTQTPGGGI